MNDRRVVIEFVRLARETGYYWKWSNEGVWNGPFRTRLDAENNAEYDRLLKSVP